MNKFVVNATNANLFYAYFVPIVSFQWKRMGYFPVTLLLGTEAEWSVLPKTKFVYDHIRQQSTIIPIARISGFKDSTIIQTSRIFVSAFEFAPDDYILTSDADMIPLSKQWFNQQDFNKNLHIFGADAYARKRFPICYLGANAATWRGMMGIHANSIQAAMGAMDRGRDNWNYDELLVTEKILGNPIYHTSCQLIDRGWTSGRAHRRLDRDAWDWHNQTDLIDAHSPRPGYIHWATLEPVFKAYCTEDDFNYLKQYTESFNKIP